jgi:hypothetical protein
MQQLILDTTVRDTLVQRLLASLAGSAPGSTAELRGSLAAGNADAYSDVDVLWQVPDELFAEAVGRMAEILSRVHPVESLRSDPDYQRSDRRRLFFVQFQGLPLFWRADVDVLAQSLHGDLSYDRHNPAARGDDWSPSHSALMNAIAAVKALLREYSGSSGGGSHGAGTAGMGARSAVFTGDRENTARELLKRGFERAGLPVPQGEAQELIPVLAEGIAAMDPAKAPLAGRIVALHRQVFGPAGT